MLFYVSRNESLGNFAIADFGLCSQMCPALSKNKKQKWNEALSFSALSESVVLDLWVKDCKQKKSCKSSVFTVWLYQYNYIQHNASLKKNLNNKSWAQYLSWPFYLKRWCKSCHFCNNDLFTVDFFKLWHWCGFDKEQNFVFIAMKWLQVRIIENESLSQASPGLFLWSECERSWIFPPLSFSLRLVWHK